MNRNARVWWLVAFAALSVVFWRSPVLFPLRAFVVLVHETGHAVTALLTGASVDHLVVRPDESGEVLYRGGWPVLIASAGYVGTALLGSLLLALTRRPAAHRVAAGALGAVLIAVTLVYVPFHNPFGFGLGLAWGALLVFLAARNFRHLPRVIDALAVMLCLYAVYDFADFLVYDTARSDAGILARYLGLPWLGYPIGLGWVVVSLWLMWRGLRAALGGPAPAPRKRLA
jgi:hypothetical protein